MTKTKYPAKYLTPIAEDVKDKLALFCARIEIGGSIRRKRSECGDIEIVCIPKMMAMPNADLFHPIVDVRLPMFVNTIEEYFLPDIAKKHDIKLIGDPAVGKYIRRITPGGIQLDIFVAERDNWGYILVLRTGGKTFNRWLVGPKGLKAQGYTPVGGCITRTRDGVVMSTPEEEDVFKLLRMPYRRPEYRI
jgi:DNA polymerase/3'-5' exonuclease PolX